MGCDCNRNRSRLEGCEKSERADLCLGVIRNRILGAESVRRREPERLADIKRIGLWRYLRRQLIISSVHVAVNVIAVVERYPTCFSRI